MRLQWASSEIETLWRPRLTKVQEMVSFLEVNSVVDGKRLAALVMLKAGSPEWYTYFRNKMAVLPIGVAKLQEYSNESVFPKEGDSYAIRALVSTDQLNIPSSDSEFGAVLGYPPCCTEFFTRDWTNAGHRDPLRAQLDLGPGLGVVPRNVTHNTALRFIGVRPVFHLPCSFACPATLEIAEYLKDRACKSGYAEAYEWMVEILGSKFSVSAKHGIGIIEHPFFRVVYDTDKVDWSVTFSDQTVRQENDFDSFWKDNGFNNVFGMETAHQEIINRLVHLGTPVDSVVDLGAGNGYLLAKIGRVLGARDLRAVEADKDRLERGRVTFPEVKFFFENIGSTGVGPADLVLISDRRFEEGVPLTEVGKLVSKYLLIYSYDGGLKTTFDFNGLVLLSKSQNIAIYRKA